MRDRIAELQPAPFDADYRVPPLQGLDATGEAVHVDFEKAPALVFYFSRDCRFCDRQFPFWKKLFDQSVGADIRIVGVVARSTEVGAAKQYLHRFRAESLQTLFVDAETLRAYRLTDTPTTLLVSTSGTVKKGWVGVLPVGARRDSSRSRGGQVEIE